MRLVNVLNADASSKNPHAVRVTYQLGENLFAVVKFFGNEGNVFTVKFWVGSTLHQVQNRWSTRTPVTGHTAEKLARIAEGEIQRFSNMILLYQNVGFAQSQYRFRHADTSYITDWVSESDPSFRNYIDYPEYWHIHDAR